MQRVQRIEELIEKIDSVSDPQLRGNAVELVQSLMELHGEGINRLLEIVAEDRSGQAIIDTIGKDQLVGGLLMLYGLHPQKGRIGLGADADIVLVDPESRWPVTDADILSKAGWSPFSGRTLFGRAVATYVRGKLVASDGHVLAEPGTGNFLPGLGAQVS